MRQGRLKFPTERPVGHYHCISRIVDRRFIFEEAEKEHFTRLMREYEAFCQVRVLTFCVMSNHYHGLTQDPKDCRWCGYGEAVAGIRIAKEGFEFFLQLIVCPWEFCSEAIESAGPTTSRLPSYGCCEWCASFWTAAMKFAEPALSYGVRGYLRPNQTERGPSASLRHRSPRR